MKRKEEHHSCQIRELQKSAKMEAMDRTRLDSRAKVWKVKSPILLKGLIFVLACSVHFVHRRFLANFHRIARIVRGQNEQSMRVKRSDPKKSANRKPAQIGTCCEWVLPWGVSCKGLRLWVGCLLCGAHTREAPRVVEVQNVCRFVLVPSKGIFWGHPVGCKFGWGWSSLNIFGLTIDLHDVCL